MFTGIIEDIGSVVRVSASKLEVLTALDGINTGDSVAVNGICLTVTRVERQKNVFKTCFDYTPETAKKTSLEIVKPGALVNLERALKAGARLGGHFVTGHIEGTAVIVAVSRAGNSSVFTFKPNKTEILKYIVPKGSVAVEGISLTVAKCSRETFEVSVIPFSLETTTLKLKRKGDTVNIETDIIAKYVENINTFNKTPQLSREFLKQNGFI